MAVISNQSLEVPYQDSVVEKTGMLSFSWQSFFRILQSMLSPLGIEKSFSLANNQASAADLVGMQFDYKKVNQVNIEYLIQRITTSTGTTELIQTGVFQLAYKPITAAWYINTVGSTGPDAGGITFSVTATGQVQYTSTNITGTANISKITYRARTLGAKYAS